MERQCTVAELQAEIVRLTWELAGAKGAVRELRAEIDELHNYDPREM